MIRFAEITNKNIWKVCTLELFFFFFFVSIEDMM